jgi:hypothetical protein
MLYSTSPEATALYGTPYLLFAIGPVLFFWLTRIWMVTFRGALHEDPVVFSLQDRVSYIVAAIITALAVCATGTWPGLQTVR